MTQCPSCGATNAEGVAFCKRCGNRIDSEPQVKCPTCSQLNPIDVTYCWSCGAELPKGGVSESEKIVAPDKTEVPPVETTVTKKCPECGQMVNPFASICSHCGHEFGKSSVTPITTPRRPDATMLNVAGILLILSGLIAFYTSYRFFVAQELVYEELGYSVGSIACCGMLEIVFGIGAILGGYVATTQRRFTLALIGSILGMLSLGPLFAGSILAFLALIIITLRRDDFED